MKEELEKALLTLVEKYDVEIKVHVSDNKKVVSFQGTVREKIHQGYFGSEAMLKDLEPGYNKMVEEIKKEIAKDFNLTTEELDKIIEDMEKK